MTTYKWIKEQEFLFLKNWYKLQLKLYQENFRIDSTVSNKNTKLWHEVRK